MQYSIPLPVNFHAEQIRERVNQRRALFDAHAGLVHKSFVYNEQDHIYAPFYVWKDMDKAQGFLMDELFQGVIDSFNRQRVRTWFVLSMLQGSKNLTPSYAMREIDLIAPEERLGHFAASEKNMQAELQASHPSLCFHVSALDAERWEVMRFSLWADKAGAAKPHSDCFQPYDVLHVSAPL
jgi:hypothetical protein